MSEPRLVEITTWDAARETYRSKHLRQGLYDGGVVMENVLINLWGTAHRDRRRLENPLFRRDVLFEYERKDFPAVLAATLAPHIAAGRLELLDFGHRVMLELTAVNAGVDIPVGDPDAIARLTDQLALFIEGARILHYTGDKPAKEAEVAAALGEFEREFIEPSLARRAAMPADEEPSDILGVLHRNVEGLDLDPSTIVRETAFFLLTGASTSATTLTKTMDNVFSWIGDHPDDEARLVDDAAFVQRCILETLRLSPISPIAARWALADFALADGTAIAEGDRVHIDMGAANRDPSVFGPTAGEFDPEREIPDDVPRHGVSFGHGMHACIGQELAVGIDPDPHDGFDQRLFGLVGTVIQELIGLGARLDPDHPPEIDPTSERHTYRRYPLVLTAV